MNKKWEAGLSALISKKAPISVVIPCYRCAETIERAVTSVWTQTARPAEVFLVEDGSGDDTLKRLWDIQRHYTKDWIKVIPLAENGGPSVARNIGWGVCTQRYVAFLDADDAWHPRKIEIQYAWMREHPEVALTGHQHVWIKEGVILQLTLPNKWRAQQIGCLRLLLSNRFSTSSAMLRRDLLFRFEPARRYSEDYLLWLQIVFSGYHAYLLDLPLAYRYKAAYGEAGLSKNLWKMWKGELANYRRLRDERIISDSAYGFLALYSLTKFLRRLIKKTK